MPAHPAQQTSAESSGVPVSGGRDTRSLEGTGRRDHRAQPPTAPVAAASHRRPASSNSARPSTKCPTEPARTAPDPISPPKAITQRFALGRDLWSHPPNAPPHAPLSRSTHLTQRSSTRRQRHLAARRGDHPHRTNAGSSVRGWWLPRPRASSWGPHHLPATSVSRWREAEPAPSLAARSSREKRAWRYRSNHGQVPRSSCRNWHWEVLHLPEVNPGRHATAAHSCRASRRRNCYSQG